MNPQTAEWAQWAADSLFRATWQGGVLIVIVFVLQWALRDRLTPRWRYALWLIVLARLALPVTPGSSVSLFNLSWERSDVSSPPPAEGLVTIRRYGPIDYSAAEQPRVSAPAVEPTPVAARGWSAFEITVAAWLAGVLGFVAVVCVVNFRARRSIRRGAVLTGGGVEQLLAACRHRMDVRRPVAVVESSAVGSPALCGLWRVKILLPVGMSGRLSCQELRWVLLHELAHVRRWDVPVNWLMIAVQAVHWFNPLVWLALWMMRGDREAACDALVLSRSGPNDASDYGRAILRVLETVHRRGSPLGAVAMAESIGQLERRLTMIKRYQRPGVVSGVAGLTLLILLGCAGLTDKAADTNRAESTTNLTIATYDINDLIHVPPDFEGPATLGVIETPEESDESSQDERESDTPSRDAMIAEVIELIRETIDPYSWRAHGGETGSIRHINGVLIINTTEKNHRHITDLMAQLREVRALRITYGTRFMLVDPAFVDRFVENAGIEADRWNPGAMPPTIVLSEPELQRLMRTVNDDRRAVLVAAPRVTAFNGQRANVTVSTQTAFVQNLAVVEGEGGTGLQPDIGTFGEGVYVDIKGTRSADHRHVTMMFKARLTELKGLDTRPVPNAPEGIEGVIEVPEFSDWQTEITVSLPDKAPLLIVGDVIEVAQEANAGAAILSKIPLVNRLTTNHSTIKDRRRVLFLIRPTIIVPTERQSDEGVEELFPGLRVPPELSPTDDSQTRNDWSDRVSRIGKLIGEAMELRKQLRYEEALTTLEEASSIDPNNSVVKAVKEMIEEIHILRELGSSRKNFGSTGIIAYPPDWPKISSDARR